MLMLILEQCSMKICMSFRNKNCGNRKSWDYVGNEEWPVRMNTMKPEKMKICFISEDVLHASTTDLWMISSLDQALRHTRSDD